MVVVILLAHHDDEYFLSARIEREVTVGNDVYVVYTTHGSAYGTSPERREGESLRALGLLRVPPSHVIFVGRDHEVADGSAAGRGPEILSACRAALDRLAVGRLITPAWEGGHPDHDVTHLVGRRLSREWGIGHEMYEFPLYTAAGAPRGFFRVNRFPASRGHRHDSRLRLVERLRALFLARCYTSQWRSFVGLLPEATVRFLLLGTQQLRRVPPGDIDYTQPPHPKPLYYEMRFGADFETIAADARSILGQGDAADVAHFRSQA
jgi:LmbE family N-acetylglucosaminyl deacetylase